jgi:hypothetical protein
LKRFAIVAALLVPAFLVAGGAIIATTSGSDDSESSDPVDYPDLRVKEPSRLRLGNRNDEDKVFLRFETIAWNAGAGPLELRPENDEEDATTHAFQRLYTHDDRGDLVFVRESPVGSFAYHAEHKHWHFGNFARYEVHEVADDGSISDEVVASSDKVSFCLLDDEEIALDMEGAPQEAGYHECKQDKNQGISTGWGDSYESFLPGQNIDITGVPDGDYWLVYTSDPSDLIKESNEENNTSSVKLTLKEGEIEVFYKDPTPTPRGNDDEDDDD